MFGGVEVGLTERFRAVDRVRRRRIELMSLGLVIIHMRSPRLTDWTIIRDLREGVVLGSAVPSDDEMKHDVARSIDRRTWLACHVTSPKANLAKLMASQGQPNENRTKTVGQDDRKTGQTDDRGQNG